MTGSTERLDGLFQSPARLRVAAFLSGCTRATFTAIQEHLELEKGTLSKSLQALEAAGYVQVEKEFVGRRPRTWAALTGSGRDAIQSYLSSLQRIVAADAAHGAAAGEAPASSSRRSSSTS